MALVLVVEDDPWSQRIVVDLLEMRGHEVLAARDRTQGGVTAAPGGLYLAGIRYAPGLALPSEPADPTMPPL